MLASIAACAARSPHYADVGAHKAAAVVADAGMDVLDERQLDHERAGGAAPDRTGGLGVQRLGLGIGGADEREEGGVGDGGHDGIFLAGCGMTMKG